MEQIEPTLDKRQTEIVEILAIAFAAAGIPFSFQSYDDADEPGIETGCGLIVFPSPVTVKTLAGGRDVPGYTLGHLNFTTGGYWEPPDCDFVELHTSVALWDIAAQAALHSVKCRVEAALENFALGREAEREAKEAEELKEKYGCGGDFRCASERCPIHYQPMPDGDPDFAADDFAYERARDMRAFSGRRLGP